MLKRISCFLTAFLGFVIFQAAAQDQPRQYWVSLYGGHQEYRGDLGSEFFNFDVGSDWTIGYSASVYLNDYLDIGLTIGLSTFDFNYSSNPNAPTGQRSFRKNGVNTELFLRYKLANGKLFSKGAVFQPYLMAGAGVTSYVGGDQGIDNGTAVSVPLGIGVNIPFTRFSSLFLEATYHRTFADKFDGSSGLDDRSHDDFITYTTGFRIPLRQFVRGDSKNTEEAPPMVLLRDEHSTDDSTDTDMPKVDSISVDNNVDEGDGVGTLTVTVEEYLPRLVDPALIEYPKDDRDGDQIIDGVDKCPDEAGLSQFDGCPVEKMLNIKAEVEQIAGRIKFDHNTSAIPTSLHKDLNRLVDIMVEYPKMNLFISAFTDSAGSTLYNQKLSKDRANAVKEYLKNQGVDDMRLTAEGYGEILFIASNDTKAGREKNRRVELRLYLPEN